MKRSRFNLDTGTSEAKPPTQGISSRAPWKTGHKREEMELHWGVF